MDSDGLLAALRPFGQEHLLAFWQQLSAAERDSLAGQIQGIDFRLIQKLHAQGQDQSNFRDLALRGTACRISSRRCKEPHLA